jgi:hypothetical protein
MAPPDTLTPDEQLAEAADDVPIEDFIKANNARDRGEPVPPLKPAEDEGQAKEPEAPALATDQPPPAAAPESDASRPKSRRHDPRVAVQEAIRKQREAERAAEALRERVAHAEAELQRQRSPQAALHPAQAELPRQPQPPPWDGGDPRDPEPMPEQFTAQLDPYTARMEARMAWAARKESRLLLAHQARQQEHLRNEAVYQHRVTRLQQQFEAYERIDPGFRDRIDFDIARQMTWTTPNPREYGGLVAGTALGDLVMDSQEVNPAELMLYFSEHKHDFQRIAALHPLLQAVALGEVKGRLAAAHTSRPSVTRTISTASPPIKPPVVSSMTSDDEIDDGEDLSETALNRHIRRENARELKHRHLRRLR